MVKGPKNIRKYYERIIKDNWSMDIHELIGGTKDKIVWIDSQT